MKFTSIVFLALLSLENCSGFLQPQRPSYPALAMGKLYSSGDDGDSNIPKQSRLEGNTRDPSEQEMQIMDEMITKLSDAKPYELPNAVRRAFRVISSPKFFMRIAERTDKATDATEKEKLEALASNLVATLEAVVETTEETLDERAKGVERILKAAAEPESGEFLVPLLPQQVEGMRKEVEKLEPAIYTWKARPDHEDLGLIAQEVEKVIPHVVTQPENEEDYYSINYPELIPVLIKAIQE